MIVFNDFGVNSKPFEARPPMGEGLKVKGLSAKVASFFIKAYNKQNG